MVETLIKKLHNHGISASSRPEHFASDVDWQRKVEQAVKAAEVVVVLIDPKHESDRSQQFEWRVVLEAHWLDPSKRLIPLLLWDAELPSFLPSRQALRVRASKAANFP